VIQNGRAVPVGALGRHERRALRRLGEELLAGAGVGAWIHHEKIVAVHVRRQLSPRELDGLDPAWLAIPAVDMG
jgi:hypothetical protein